MDWVKLRHEESYVYVVFVNKEVKYVGKGCGERYKHPTSGCSSVVELNRDLFEGKIIEVRFLLDNETDFIASLTERDLIGNLSAKYNLYNKQIPKEFNVFDIGEDDLYNYCRPYLYSQQCKLEREHWSYNGELEANLY